MKYLKILLILLLLCGCAKQEEAKPEETGEDPIPAYFLSLPEHPSDEDEIFVCANDGLHKEELWDDFMDEVADQRDCDITIGRYTIEGDVIYELLVHDGNGFVLYTDSSRDRFGNFEEITSENRKYLYDLAYLTIEEINDTKKPFVNRYVFMSDEDLKDEEEVKAYLDEVSAGKESDMVMIWAMQQPAE